MGEHEVQSGYDAEELRSFARVVTVHPETSTLDAIRLMKKHKIACLPVVDRHGTLVGIVTERDFMTIADRLLEAHLS